jgi:HEAT repeat protein
MKIKEKSGDLKEILKNKKASFEERILAIEALCSIYDSIDVEELKILLNSPYFGLSVLGCELATHFQVEGVEEDILKLLSHPINDVRIAALNAVALFYKDKIEKEKLEKVLLKRLSDTSSFVAITASWVFLQIDKKRGEENLKKWVFDRYLENRRFAASAISQSGIFGEKLASFVLENSEDEYVKANIAIGLIGQRKKIKKSSDVLFNFIGNKTKMWMLENSKNPLFQSISPSRIRHIDQIPNYPEAIDQSIQLNILSILAILEDKKAEIAIRSFLKKKKWGITGLAAIMLLQEGDEKSREVLKNLLKDEDKFIRIQAALALASIGKEKSVLGVLEEAYFEVDHRLKLIILESIGKVGSDKSFPFLLKVLEEPFLIRKILAAGALIQIINF